VTLSWLLERVPDMSGDTAIAWRDSATTYGDLAERVHQLMEQFAELGPPVGAVVALEADFLPDAVAALLALIERSAILVPLTSTVEAHKSRFREIAEIEWIVDVDDAAVRSRPTGVTATHPLMRSLKEIEHPGLVLFSSGSTGEPKAALHDFVPLLEKFRVPRKAWRTMAFLLFDHIGGINTLLYTLSNGGMLVIVEDRHPNVVCELIERHGVELLPTSPTFLNLLFVSGAHEQHDLSSLQLVTYGTEVMPEVTLQRVHAALPAARLQQTYGLSELGILRSKSRASDSLWVKLGGEGFETRVTDEGLLEIRARSAMLGYLNTPSPFTDDGWFNTGDRVEIDGEYFRVLGRVSEMINVGGNKVDPAEVEDALLQVDGVVDAVVFSEPHGLLGQVVAARIRIEEGDDPAAFRSRMRVELGKRLARHEVPQRVYLSTEAVHNQRFKRMRR
jgi:long-chain acyl-CoA synthetase